MDHSKTKQQQSSKLKVKRKVKTKSKVKVVKKSSTTTKSTNKSNNPKESQPSSSLVASEISVESSFSKVDQIGGGASSIDAEESVASQSEVIGKSASNKVASGTSDKMSNKKVKVKSKVKSKVKIRSKTKVKVKIKSPLVGVVSPVDSQVKTSAEASETNQSLSTVQSDVISRVDPQSTTQPSESNKAPPPSPDCPVGNATKTSKTPEAMCESNVKTAVSRNSLDSGSTLMSSAQIHSRSAVLPGASTSNIRVNSKATIQARFSWMYRCPTEYDDYDPNQPFDISSALQGGSPIVISRNKDELDKVIIIDAYGAAEVVPAHRAPKKPAKSPSTSTKSKSSKSAPLDPESFSAGAPIIFSSQIVLPKSDSDTTSSSAQAEGSNPNATGGSGASSNSSQPSQGN